MVRIGNIARVKVGLATAPFAGVGHAASLCFWTLSVLPVSIYALMGTPANAASINTEASSPQASPRVAPHAAAPRAAVVQAIVKAAPAPAAPAQAAVSNARALRPTAVANRSGDGVPDQSWGGAQANATAAPIVRVPALQVAIPQVPARQAPVRQVNVPVLGREGPAAHTAPAKPPATPAAQIAISITASEPVLTSIVRPQDVASFQKIGSPYQVNGTWYVPAHEPNYDESGVASWYGSEFQGRPTANGEIFDMNVVSGAHPTLPIPSLVEVTNLVNGRSIVVRVNDRGPFVSSRLIDMSARGAELLGFKQQGHTQVRVRYVGPATPEPIVTADNISTGRASVVAQAAPPNGPAFVQVGAFAQLANAQRARDQATGLGPVRVVEVTQADGNPLYRVVMGPVANRMEADAKAQEMSMSGFTGARVLASLN